MPDAPNSDLDLRSYFIESHDLYCEIAYDGLFQFTNRAWKTILGYEPEELIGTHFEKLIHPDDQIGSQNSFKEKASPDRGFFRNRYRHKKGNYLTFLWSGRYNASRQTVHAHARDITDDQHMSQLLTKVAAIQDAYMHHGAHKLGLFDQILKEVLAATESEVGFIAEIIESSPDHHELTKIYTCSPALTRPHLDSLAIETIESGLINIKDGLGIVDKKSGFLIRNYMSVPLYYLGEYVGLVGIANRTCGYDTEFANKLKPLIEATASVIGLYLAAQRENALRERFMVIAENLPIMLTEFGPEGRITWFNRFFREKVKIDEDGFGQADVLADLFGNSSGDRTELDRARTFMLSGRSDWEDFILKSKSGESFPSMWTNIKLKDGRLIGIGQDLTERRAAEAKMIQSSKMASLGEMSAGVSHEINNPLTVIQGSAFRAIANLKTAGDELEKFDDVEGDLNRIIQNCDRIARIVRGLRAFSRNVEHEPFTPTPLATVIEDLMNLAHERFKNDHIDLSINLEDRFVIDCRPIQLGQVLMNLLNNAYDAVNEPKVAVKAVSISASRIGENVQIVIADSGQGITKSLQHRIFEPFFTTKEVGKGTGLGLSISKGIIESHNGRLWFDTSTNEARFIIELPIHQNTSDK